MTQACAIFKTSFLKVTMKDCELLAIFTLRYLRTTTTMLQDCLLFGDFTLPENHHYMLQMCVLYRRDFTLHYQRTTNMLYTEVLFIFFETLHYWGPPLCYKSVYYGQDFTLRYLRTTTMGLSLPVTTISPFQIIRADETIIPKLSTW